MTAAPATFEQWVRKRPAWAVIARKEFTDHLLSVRFIALLVILGMVGLGAVYSAAGELRDVAPQTVGEPGLFLRLFTVSAEPLRLSFLQFIGFLAPILGIAYGFDAVNGERSQGTLPRLVSQPIHRDDVINGKFVAGLGVVGLTMVVVTVLVAGLGIVLLGVVPGPGELVRLFVWMVAAVIYVGVWLAFATFCSVAMARAATSAIVAIGVWLLLALFGTLLAELVAGIVSPVSGSDPLSQAANLRAQLNLSRLSPITLYQEAATALLSPGVRSVGLVTLEQLDRAVVSELGIGQSLLLVWPQLVGMVAASVVVFAVAYVKFMRQEVRA